MLYEIHHRRERSVGGFVHDAAFSVNRSIPLLFFFFAFPFFFLLLQSREAHLSDFPDLLLAYPNFITYACSFDKIPSSEDCVLLSRTASTTLGWQSFVHN